MAAQFTAFAQVAGDKAAPGLNTAMLQLFGNNSNFIAHTEAHVSDKSGQEVASMPMTFERYGKNIRVEINMSHVKSRDMSPEFAAQMKQMGMDQMVTVMMPDQKTVLTIYPGLKSYAQTAMEKEEVEAANKEFKMQKTPAGKETINGHSCKKENVTLTDDKGNSQHATVWEASDMNNFPLRIQITENDATVVLNFTNVKLGRPDDAHFRAPANMSKFDSVNALMADAITKKMNSGAGK